MVKKNMQSRMIRIGHERTQRTASKASDRADSALQRLDEQISCNKGTYNSFFDARRHIDEAAFNNAHQHEINLQQLDIDSDEERNNFYTGRQSTRSCTPTALSSSSMKKPIVEGLVLPNTLTSRKKQNFINTIGYRNYGNVNRQQTKRKMSFCKPWLSLPKIAK